MEYESLSYCAIKFIVFLFNFHSTDGVWGEVVAPVVVSSK